MTFSRNSNGFLKVRAGRNKTRKIDIYLNGKYIYSTNNFSRCMDARNAAIRQGFVNVASVPVAIKFTFLPSDKIKATFA